MLVNLGREATRGLLIVPRISDDLPLLRRLGRPNAFDDPAPDASRYPHVDLATIDDGRADLVLLPDEPYVFGPDDGPEAFARTPTVLVPGRLLTWYGPSLVTAREELAQLLSG